MEIITFILYALFLIFLVSVAISLAVIVLKISFQIIFKILSIIFCLFFAIPLGVKFVTQIFTPIITLIFRNTIFQSIPVVILISIIALLLASIVSRHPTKTFRVYGRIAIGLNYLLLSLPVLFLDPTFFISTSILQTIGETLATFTFLQLIELNAITILFVYLYAVNVTAFFFMDMTN